MDTFFTDDIVHDDPTELGLALIEAIQSLDAEGETLELRRPIRGKSCNPWTAMTACSFGGYTETKGEGNTLTEAILLFAKRQKGE